MALWIEKVDDKGQLTTRRPFVNGVARVADTGVRTDGAPVFYDISVKEGRMLARTEPGWRLRISFKDTGWTSI